jgi:hypothetical protein
MFTNILEKKTYLIENEETNRVTIRQCYNKI